MIGCYTNGNYTVTIYEDGTKVKETQCDEFIAEFPESMDVKITNYCDLNCPYCHEYSTTEGKHADLLDLKFINTLRPYTEMAIGGGNPLSHPDLIPWLEKLRDRKIIANMTVNQRHFMANLPLIKKLVDEKLIHGLGVSFFTYDEEFIKELQKYPNAVLHIINGLIDYESLQNMYGKGIKLLILGYKQFRKGNSYLAVHGSDIRAKQQMMYNHFYSILRGFKVVSFDNLALKQLNVKSLLPEKIWNQFYQGDDGSHTMYIDLVNRHFALNSTSGVIFNLQDSIDDMFKIINGVRI